jgi:hypothetical protein
MEGFLEGGRQMSLCNDQVLNCSSVVADWLSDAHTQKRQQPENMTRNKIYYKSNNTFYGLLLRLSPKTLNAEMKRRRLYTAQ